jgi:alpha-beta hydrolase superfamily lysophospholipase
MTTLAHVHEERIPSSKGITIYVLSWTPPLAPRAVLVICHGVNSHSGQYLWAGAQFAAAGLAVFALDLRGRGQSDGERFYVEHVDDYVSDVAATIALAKARHPGLPLFLLGHSAGGVVSASYALDHQSELAGFICESFAFSRDPEAVALLNNDPLTANESQPAITVAALVRADERLRQEFPRMTLPVLIMHGTDDKATVCHGSEFFHETAGSRDKTLKLYEGHYHDLLNDIVKEQVLGDIRGWIDARVAV